MSSLNESNLAELMGRAQNGDALAYQDLLSQLDQFLMSFLAKAVLQSELRQDVAQEILMAVHKSRHTYASDRPFTSWFLAIAHYKLSDHLRYSYRGRKFEDLSEDIAASSVSTLEQLISIDNQLAVRRSIESLDDRSKTVVKGLKLEDKSISDLALELNTSQSNIKVIAHRAYETLRKKLENL